MTHGGELAVRTSAAVVLRQLASSADGRTLEAVARTPSLCDALVRSPVSATADKAALVSGDRDATWQCHVSAAAAAALDALVVEEHGEAEDSDDETRESGSPSPRLI